MSIGDKEFLPLKTFLQKHAKAFQQQSLARTYVVVDPARNSKIVAFITLISGEVQTDKEHALIDGDLGYTYTAYPAIKVARLAVVSNYRRSAIGRTLIDFALGTVKSRICPVVGCRFIVVDAKKASVPFYDRCGFTMLDTEENRARSEPVMFIDLHKIEI